MHSSLRSINFWRIIIINLMVSSLVYMLMPLWPLMLEHNESVPVQTSGWMMMLFGIGLFIPGPFSSYLVDKYRRKDVCLWAITLLVLVSLLSMLELPLWAVGALRFAQGVSFALFHIVLGSTILIDITVSERRDLASYIYFWACRFALGLGPAFGILALQPQLWYYLRFFPVLCGIVAVYLVARIDLPFRTPLEPKVLSFDRCWLVRGWPFAVLLFPVTFALGVEMAGNLHPLFFVFLLCGFVLALILHFTVFYRSDMRAEIFTGYLFVFASFLILLTIQENSFTRIAAMLLGYGVGCVTGRVQYFLTQMSKHTERGSAQGTYKLTFEAGICFGFFFTCSLGSSFIQGMQIVCLCLVASSALLYLVFVHPWYLRHMTRH